MEIKYVHRRRAQFKYVNQRRVSKNRPKIKIFSPTSGDRERSDEGFNGAKNEDRDNDTMSRARDRSVVSDGSSIERIPNESRNPQARLTRKYKRERSFSSDTSVVSPKLHSRGRPVRERRKKSVLRDRLCDDVFARYFRKIWRDTPEEKRDRCTYLNCLWFYMYNNDCFRENVPAWIKNENIFSKTYAFFPIVMWSHWCLLIFCHFGESLKSRTRTPCVLLLDSLHRLDTMRLKPLIRRLVVDIFRSEGRHESIERIGKIPLLVPKVPQQRNDKECGIFVLYYTQLFMESAPRDFSISKGYPYFMKDDWFSEEELEGFYEKLESLEIGSSDEE